MYTCAGSRIRRTSVFAAATAAVVAGLALLTAPMVAASQPRLTSPAVGFEAALDPVFSPPPATTAARFGYRPSPLAPVTVAPSTHALSARAATAGLTTTRYPSRYDLRSRGRMSAVRDQGSLGACWAFATFGSLESILLPAERRDFSEDNLLLRSGFDWGYSDGGNDQMAAAYLLRWSGPVNESSDAYGDGYAPPGLTAEKHVQSWVRLPRPASPRSLSVLKGAMERFGALYAVIEYAPGSYRSRTHAYYYAGTSGPNHAIDIIGWNDGYRATNFSRRPPGNGAFLCRNSWGRTWGARGYFWVSYYDRFIESNVSAFPQVEKATNYASCYQYDPCGETDGLGWPSSPTGWFANRFTAVANGSLAAVGFGVPSGNAAYWVYAGASLSQLTQVASGSTAFAGFTTVKLRTPVTLTSGRSFVVAVCQVTPGYGYPVPVEVPIPGYDSRATALPGQSFVSSDGKSWTDLTTIPGCADSNACLKAYTSN